MIFRPGIGKIDFYAFEVGKRVNLRIVVRYFGFASQPQGRGFEYSFPTYSESEFNVIEASTTPLNASTLKYGPNSLFLFIFVIYDKYSTN